MIEEIADLPEGTLGFKISGDVTFPWFASITACPSVSQLWARKPGRSWLEKSCPSS